MRSSRPSQIFLTVLIGTFGVFGVLLGKVLDPPTFATRSLAHVQVEICPSRLTLIIERRPLRITRRNFRFLESISFVTGETFHSRIYRPHSEIIVPTLFARRQNDGNRL